MGTILSFPQSDLSRKYALVRDAILNKQPLSAMYNGQSRLLCPHVLGEDKDGNFQALFYQFGGGSSSRPIERGASPNNWRCFALTKLSEVKIIEDRWRTAPLEREQTCVKVVHFEVPAG